MPEADDLDRASELTQWANEVATAKVRAAAKPEQVQNPDGSWPITVCQECEDDIPPARLALGKIRCVHCQEWIERGYRR